MEPIFEEDNFICKADCEDLIFYHKNNCPKNETSQGIWNNRIVTSYNDNIKNLINSIHYKVLYRIQNFYGENEVYLQFSNLVYWGKGMELVPHADNFWIDDPQAFHHAHYRAYSSILYLNDSFKGGETYFPEYNYNIKPKTGKLTFYTSGAKHIHGVKEITNGTRYTMGMWFTKDPNHSILK